MRLVISVSRFIDAPPEAVRSHLGEISNLVDFVGYGPIPGIRSARWEDGGEMRVGAVRRVENTDGSTHREEVVRCEPDLVEDRIFDFDSPLRHLVREIRDRFELARAEGRTRLDRSFAVELKSPLTYPAAWVIGTLALRPALRRHLEILGRRVGR